MSRYLSKSKFKTSYECPNKLHFLQSKEFGNIKDGNDFLKALAEGGFQVGALAKVYHPGGVDLEGLSTEEALARTEELLRQESVTIFEAAFRHESLLVRVDVLVKSGNVLTLKEVKAKSYLPGEDDFWKKRDPGLDGEWEEYLVDVAFQTYVARLACPGMTVDPYLLLIDKSRTSSIDGLHQMFRIRDVNGRPSVILSPQASSIPVSDRLLAEVSVSGEVDYLLKHHKFQGKCFSNYLKILLGILETSVVPAPQVSSACKSCEFRILESMEHEGKKSGFKECWSRALGTRADFSKPMIFEIWDSRKSQEFIDEGKVFMEDLSRKDLIPKKGESPSKLGGFSKVERQWIQVRSAVERRPDASVDLNGLRSFLGGLTWPLHFIDFETSMMALPFHKGRRPYEQIAFQFSHHVMHRDGRIEHRDQFIHLDPAVFPNFEFIRALKASLSGDKGTIFRYADHENTVIKQIRAQLEATPPSDSEELIQFIDEIRSSSESDAKKGIRPGKRAMIDLRKIVVAYFYHPLMGGSNSIKKVSPAVLADSKSLQRKYGNSIYGRNLEIRSLNFDSKVWINLDNQGKVIDPYKQLPRLPDSESEDEDRLFGAEKVNDGGAALTAWARMQFSEMSQEERDTLRTALLQYCELDTLSMVWILEYFREKVAEADQDEAA